MLADPGQPVRDIVEIPDRGVFEVLCAPLKDDDGALIGSVHTMHDISRSVHVEVRRRSTRTTCSRCSTRCHADLPQGRRGPVLVVNKAFAESAGKEREDILGRTAADVFPRRSRRTSASTTSDCSKRAGGTARFAGLARRPGRRQVELHRSVYADLAARAAASWAWSSTSPTPWRPARSCARARPAARPLRHQPSGCAVYEVRGDGRSPDDYMLKDINRTASPWTGCGGRTPSAAAGRLWPPMAERECAPGAVARVAHG